MEQLTKTRSSATASESSGTEAPSSITRSKWIGWSSFFFAIVQSVCSAFVALSAESAC